MNTSAEMQLKMIEQYARIGADDEDIALLTGLSATLLLERFSAEVKHARAERRAILLKAIWEAFKAGNIPITTLLAKVELGWADPANHGKDSPPTEPGEPFDFESFESEFSRVHSIGKVGDEGILRRLALMAMHDQLQSPDDPSSSLDSCTISALSPGRSSNEPSSTTDGSPSIQRQNKPSS